MSEQHEEVVLSEWEREALVAMEGRLAETDPALHRRLRAGRRSLGTLRPWLVVWLLWALGGGLTVATFTSSLWVAVIGLGVMGAGGALAVRPAAALVARWRRPGGPVTS